MFHRTPFVALVFFPNCNNSCDGKSLDLPGKYATVRADKWGEADCPIFGIVSEQYTPLQNREAFRFFDPIVGEGAAIYHTAGALGRGERVWLLAKLPGYITVAADDITDKYLLLSNSHDGSSAVQIKFTPIRVVCQNTLTFALSDGLAFRVPHLGDLHERLDDAREMIGLIHERYGEIEVSFRRLASVHLDEDRLGEYLVKVFPNPVDPNDGKRLELARSHRMWAGHFYRDGKGNRLPGVEGTLWAAYNGVAEFIDHRSYQWLTPNRRLRSVWFGRGASTKARAYRVAHEKAAVWLN